MTEEQFWSRVDKRLDGCWVWTGSIAKERGGYGIVYYSKKMWRSHRLAWLLSQGSIPIGKYVLHSCDNPPCVNPDHLWVGTQSDNMKDMHDKGRHPSPGQPPGEEHAMAKLTDSAVRDIHRRVREGEWQAQVAEDYGVCVETVEFIVRGRTWRHLGLRPLPRRRGSDKPGAKLTEEQVVEMRRRAARGEKGAVLASEFGVGRTTVFNIIKRNRWAHVP
jgi:hypothetical protein